MNLETLQNNIGNLFKSEDLLKEALTHRSYLNENASWPFRNNERLEFLGDAVLELCVTEDLFERYGNKEEGHLTIYRAALVNSKMLSRIAREIGLDKEMLASKGEIKEIGNGGGENILGDGVEALIGSIYLDRGFEPSRKFVRRFVMVHIEDVVKNGAKDAKSQIQEITQEKHSVTPVYKVIEESGPAHQKIFKVGLYLGDDLRSEGRGNSKQNAELEAAEKLLRVLEP